MSGSCRGASRGRRLFVCCENALSWPEVADAFAAAAAATSPEIRRCLSFVQPWKSFLEEDLPGHGVVGGEAS